MAENSAIETWQLDHGDCRALMAEMAEASIDSIVTDPPYELGFMGREWDRTGIANDRAMWTAALRVLKPGGYLVAFSHARTYHRMVCAIEDAGFEIRDQIMWIYGSGFPKGGVRDGRGTCLKPAHEPIVVARKPFIGSAKDCIASHGTGALNIDACRIMGTVQIPGNVRSSVPSGSNGIYGLDVRPRRQVDWRPADGGRWPANVVHDGSDEVLAGFPDSNGGGDIHRRSSPKTSGIYGAFAGDDDRWAGYADTGSAARFFYCAKASKADRDEGLAHLDPQAFVQFQTGNGESGQASSLSAGRETQYRNTHPTVKPEALMRWLVRLVTPQGGLALDPFTGSGSTGKAAVLEGRRFVGCELTEAYMPIARARIAAAMERAASDRTMVDEAGRQADMFGAAA